MCRNIFQSVRRQFMSKSAGTLFTLLKSDTIAPSFVIAPFSMTDVLVNTSCCKLGLGCMDGIMDNSTELEIRELSFNPSWIHYIHLHTQILLGTV